MATSSAQAAISERISRMTRREPVFLAENGFFLIDISRNWNDNNGEIRLSTRWTQAENE